MDKNVYPFLSEVKELQKNKNIDELQEQLLTVIGMYGLKTDEVAALLFSTMKIVLSQKANKEMLRDSFKIDVEKLGPEGIFAVQQALLESYVNKNNFS